ncbi:MAG: hypothetical protein JWQ84_2326 [Mucilaginibacter sp.]|nr:hypothetical protein [Mucilaginibacter sp.]
MKTVHQLTEYPASSNVYMKWAIYWILVFLSLIAILSIGMMIVYGCFNCRV